jgi:hypothetical protein
LKTRGQLAVKLIGINDASTLRIFCQTHDSDGFAPLEQATFSGTKEQCFLLAYRALCHEYSKKSDVLDSIPECLEPAPCKSRKSRARLHVRVS